MYPKILEIYGPIAINSYGLMIAIGLGTFLHLALGSDRRKKLMSYEAFYEVVFVGLALGIVGGRVLYVATAQTAGPWYHALLPWEGGFSLLGTIAAIFIGLPFYFRYKKTPILPTFDLAAIYAPLLQAIARIGCFLAGCCYGSTCSASLPWAVRYTHPESLAPLGVLLHPSQLYSSLASFAIFLLMRFLLEARLKLPGQLVFSYLMLESLARFGVDFWRSDQAGYTSQVGWVSSYQLLALSLCVIGAFGFWLVSRRKNV